MARAQMPPRHHGKIIVVTDRTKRHPALAHAYLEALEATGGVAANGVSDVEQQLGLIRAEQLRVVRVEVTHVLDGLALIIAKHDRARARHLVLEPLEDVP